MLPRSLVYSFLLGLGFSLLALQALAGGLDDQRKSELEHLLRHDCGSCHGMTLKGGLGPALTPDALKNKPAAYLQQTISEGHSGTPMPAWKSILAAEDIDYLVELLMAKLNPS